MGWVIIVSRTIFCPPGPVPFRYAIVVSASSIFRRGGSWFFDSVGVWEENGRDAFGGCGCGDLGDDWDVSAYFAMRLGLVRGRHNWDMTDGRSISRELRNERKKLGI